MAMAVFTVALMRLRAILALWVKASTPFTLKLRMETIHPRSRGFLWLPPPLGACDRPVLPQVHPKEEHIS